MEISDPGRAAPIGAMAVVTGAAGGMGTAIARQFAREGRPLVLCDLDEIRLGNLAAELGERVPVNTVSGDIADPSFPARVVAALDNRRIGALVHTAGVSPAMADGVRVFEINWTATKRLVEAALPVMATGGAAILLASNSGHLLARPFFDRALNRLLDGKRTLVAFLIPRSSRIAYSLSKRAVQLYVKKMAPAFGKLGARIVSVSPGIIDTDMGRLERDGEPLMDRMIALTPVGRMGRATEIASVVAFLASESASFISGTDLLVDGGATAAIDEAGGVMKLR